MHIPQEAPLFVLTCSYPTPAGNALFTGYTVRRGALICTASGLQITVLLRAAQAYAGQRDLKPLSCGR